MTSYSSTSFPKRRRRWKSSSGTRWSTLRNSACPSSPRSASVRIGGILNRCVEVPQLLYVIVRRLARDDHVVHVALAQTCIRDADKPRVLLQLCNRRAAEIPHARPQ